MSYCCTLCKSGLPGNLKNNLLIKLTRFRAQLDKQDIQGDIERTIGVYPYRRLDYVNHETRIITILAEPDSQDIKATMAHTSLIDAGLYTALSYCWGGFKKTTPIFLNGISIEVTANLKVALLQLRACGYRRLWVDAICL